MKKLFLLIPALILSMMMNAKLTNITPTSPYESDAVRKALYYSSEGDTIVLGTGIYEESNSDYIAWRRSNVVMAAEGATVTIKPHVSFRVRNGARAELIGVKIDASGIGSYKNVFDAHDANDGNRLILQNCEIYGNPNQSVVYWASDKKLDSLIINNCYFHDNAQVSLRLETAALKGLTITNSTFANMANAGSFWCAPIDIKNTAEDAKVIVDHCTFYHNTSISSSYADVTTGVEGSATSDVTITNCIFAQPEPYAGSRAINLTNGGTVRNCLTFNYTKSTNGIQGATVKENCVAADPRFNDLANNKYTFDGDWVTPSVSPARGAATDGSDLGDPRWYSAEVLPSVDFASPYVLDGLHAKLNGNIALDEDNFLKQNNNSDPTQHGTATWKIHATKSCYVSVTPDIKGGSGHHYQIAIYDEDNNLICDPLAENDSWDSDITPNFGTILIPAAGDYKVVLSNLMNNSGATLRKITLAYIGGDVQTMPGTTDIDDAWFSSNGTRTAGEKIVIPSGHQHEGWVKWNVSFANTANYKAKVNIICDNGHNYTVALYKDEDDLTPITWGEGKQTEDASPLDLGAKEVPAGNYILKVTNAVQYSHAELVSVQFVNAGGGLVDIPGDITLTEAILSSRAYIDGNGEIRFTSDAEHGHVLEESVAWRVNVSKAGYYKFTTSVNSNNGHSYLVSIYNADETVLKGSVPQSGDDIWGKPKTFSTDNIYLEKGEYRVKVQNTTNNSNGRIVSISASYEGGAVVNIPNAIPLADAVVTSGATKSESEINFHGDVNEYAMWNIQAEEGLYTFTINITGTNHSKIELTVIDSEDNELYKKNLGVSGSGAAVHSGIFMPSGKYVIKVANVNPSANGCVNSISAALAENVIVIDEMADNMDEIIANNGNSMKPVLKRSFVAGMYNTICVPFNVGDNEELEGIFGAGYVLLEMTSAVLSGNELALNFATPASNIQYGRPYLIKPTQNVKNPVFGSHTIYKSTSHLTVEGADADFIGNFIKGEVPAGDQNLFLGANNTLYFDQKATPIKGMRAYFHVKVPGAANAIKRASIVGPNNVPTGIEFVNGEIQNLNGTVKTIENGQVIIIRDGIRYNVMGTKIQ